MRTFSILSLLLLLSSVASTAQDTAPAPEGTVNEVMIGIIYPSSNLVNEAAYVDPEEPTDANPFDAYAGWQKIETAAIAMAESARLLTVPGRMCSNGERAPVGESDWNEWVEDLRESGMLAYAAAKEQSQDRFMELSERLLESCVNCHARYMDVGGDPTNRCRP